MAREAHLLKVKVCTPEVRGEEAMWRELEVKVLLSKEVSCTMREQPSVVTSLLMILFS
ncbi:MAG: hypothetical protein SGPRY_014400, partial [Prymnesium sp.]